MVQEVRHDLILEITTGSRKEHNIILSVFMPHHMAWSGAGSYCDFSAAGLG